MVIIRLVDIGAICKELLFPNTHTSGSYFISPKECVPFALVCQSYNEATDYVSYSSISSILTQPHSTVLK